MRAIAIYSFGYENEGAMARGLVVGWLLSQELNQENKRIK